MSSTRSIARMTWGGLHLALTLAFSLAWAPQGFAKDVVATIYIVRHAEKKLDGSSDPDLTPEGVKRAQELAHVLRDAKLKAIFVSFEKRTSQTANPIAKATSLEPKKLGPGATAKAILEDSSGGNFLVVGHSLEVDDIAKGLGAGGVSELEEKQYDRLFLVHRVGDTVSLSQLRYGEPTD